MTKKLYQAVVTYTHPQTVVMNVEGDTYEEATKFINDYLGDKLQQFEILELEEVSNLPEETTEEAASAAIFTFPGNDTIN